MGTLPRYNRPPVAVVAALEMAVRYGPRKTVTTVVLKALLAQSYIFQPKISCLSLTSGALSAMWVSW